MVMTYPDPELFALWPSDDDASAVFEFLSPFWHGLRVKHWISIPSPTQGFVNQGERTRLMV